jgi:glucosylceramidase
MKNISKTILAKVLIFIFSFLVIGCDKNSGPTTSPIDPEPLPGNPDIASWITKPDESQKLSKQSTVLSFGSITNSSPFIDVSETTTYQTIDGFGYTLTGGSAQLINALPAATKANLLRELFSNDDNAIGISFIRISIGASDMVAAPFTYNDLTTGTDINQTNFSLSPDLTNLVPLLKEILLVNPSIKILASPWTAPAWMKTNNSFIGGNLQNTYYASYAKYFVKYIQAMQSQNIQIFAITPQNEPLNANNNPSMLMSDVEQTDFIKNHLGPQFASASINTKIITYDHNCDIPSYPINILNDATAKPFVHGSAFHLYAGDISAMSSVRNAHPDKAIYFTEQITAAGSSFAYDLAWHTKNVMIGAMKNWSRTAMAWNLAADANNGPSTPNGGCTNCKGAITIGAGITRNIGYYTIGHFSKFVPAGSTVIKSNNTGNLNSVAFRTPAGLKVLVVLNEGNTEASFNLRYGSRWCNIALAAGSVGTYTW